MAKKQAAPETAEKPKKKINIKKFDGKAKENYQTINTTVNGDTTTVTRSMHIKKVGSLVETTVLYKGVVVGVSTTFIPGVKVKTKKEWKYLIVDKAKGEADTE